MATIPEPMTEGCRGNDLQRKMSWVLNPRLNETNGRADELTTEICQIEPMPTSDDELWLEWDHLLKRVAPELAVFSPAWFSAWQQTWGQTKRWTGEVSIVTVRDPGGRLLGLLPLGHQRVGPLPLRGLIGPRIPYRALISDDEHAQRVGKAIARYVSGNRWGMLSLERLFAPQAAVKALSDVLKVKSADSRIKQELDFVSMNPPQSWDRYLDMVGVKRIRKVEANLRRLEREGVASIRRIEDPKAGQIASILQELADIERDSGLVNNPEAEFRFADDVAGKMWERILVGAVLGRHGLKCWILDFNGQPIAYNIVICVRDIWFGLMTAYRREFHRFSPGSILMLEVIRGSIEQGVRKFHLGDGTIDYKLRWGGEFNGPLQSFEVFPDSLAGRAGRLGIMMRDRIMRIMGRRQGR